MPAVTRNESSKPDLSRWSEMVDRRSENRVNFRTTGAMYLLGDDGQLPASAPIRIWTADVSATGALVKSFEELHHGRVLIELLMPELGDSLIEGRVTHRKMEQIEHLNGYKEISHLYGVHFERFIPKASLPKTATARLQQTLSSSGVHRLPQQKVQGNQKKETELSPSLTLMQRFIASMEVLFILLVLLVYCATILLF